MSSSKLLHTVVESPVLSITPPSLSPTVLSLHPSPTSPLTLLQERDARPLVCEPSLSASIFSSRTRWSPPFSANGAAAGLWELAQTSSPGSEGLLTGQLGRRNRPPWCCMSKSMRQVPRSWLNHTLVRITVTYSVCEVGNRDNRLPPLYVGQVSINLSHDVFKVLSCTADFVSHQVSTCRCLPNNRGDLQ